MNKLTKEECLEALKGLIYKSEVNETEWLEDKQCWLVKDAYQRKIGLLFQLIKEHFDNTIGFKYFKLHADSTLMTFKKSELVDYIHMVYHNWQNADLGYNNIMVYAEKLQKINDELQRVVDELNSKETRNNPPLKFEEIKPGMWVWVKDKKMYKQVIKTYVREFDEIEMVHVNGYYLGFEPNRFYRYEVKEVKE